MNPKIVIRNEADAAAITDVTMAAFNTLEISNHTEQFIIEALRAAGALTVSLVAELDGRVVGHIVFSPKHYCASRFPPLESACSAAWRAWMLVVSNSGTGASC